MNNTKAIALAVFVAISALVIGGLGWATYAVLDLEERQWRSDFEHEWNAQVSLALWRLDSRVSPALAREDSRPFTHYSAFYAPAVVFDNHGKRLPAGGILEPSPLINAELPDWMVLHFQTDNQSGWDSPQVLSQNLNAIFTKGNVSLDNVTPLRDRLRIELDRCCTPQTMLTWVEQRHGQPTGTETMLFPANPGNNPTKDIQAQQIDQSAYQNQSPNINDNNVTNLFQQRPPLSNSNTYDFNNRFQQGQKVQNETQNKPETGDLSWAMGNVMRNGEGLIVSNPVKTTRSQQVVVHMGSMSPLWLAADGQPQRLVVARLVKIGDRGVCQGLLLDWPKLQTLLAEEVKDIFPEATFEPEADAQPLAPERTMRWLPIRLNPGSAGAPPVATWTPLRIGLMSAWAAALVAIGAVGLGGWSLWSLSERRIRFVSAVTHELRTPLTTLRLYLDMMTSGLVSEPQQQSEYLQTLHGETERLNRLVANVLDFSRLERQRPRLEKTTVSVARLVEEVRGNWEERCKGVEKQLVVDNRVEPEVTVQTDVKLVEQVLGNLIDNACKYSRGAADARIWLRVYRDGTNLAWEVEDRGPGVAPRERRSIFRAFRRGKGVEVMAGGVGLGLALARQWTGLLGGRLSVGAGADGVGACFRVQLPCTSKPDR